MDPFVSAIVRQSVALGIAVGLLVALGYGLMQYAKLQRAITLNIVPPEMPDELSYP